MSGVIIYNSNVWVYLFLTLLSLFILFKYKEDFNPKALIDSLIYLTHKVNLLILFFTFLCMFMFTIVDFTDPKIITFFEDTAKGLLYYSFFNYSIYYGIKLISYMKKFFKDNDLNVWVFIKDNDIGGKGK